MDIPEVFGKKKPRGLQVRVMDVRSGFPEELGCIDVREVVWDVGSSFPSGTGCHWYQRVSHMVVI